LEGVDHVVFAVCEIMSHDTWANFHFIAHGFLARKLSGCALANSPRDFALDSRVDWGI
jgi:hypothetical protein